MPPLADGATTIDGYTQAGAAPATPTMPAALRIEISLATLAAGSDCGLIATSAGNVIRGLAINGGMAGKVNGICLQGSAAGANVVRGNHVGTDVAGAAAVGNYKGIFIDGGAHDNLVGGDTPAARNVVSGNDPYGIQMQSAGTNANTIAGNYIGTDATGTLALGNDLDGIFISAGAAGTVIGGATAAAGNLISGNGQNGIMLYAMVRSDNIISDTLIANNTIGADVTGTDRLSNESDGVALLGSVQNTTFRDNLISANKESSIYIYIDDDDVSSNHQIVGNLIGTDVTGRERLPNYGSDIVVSGSRGDVTGMQIGGDKEAERNVIGGNDNGIVLSGWRVQHNTISGNYIGTDCDGEQFASGYGNLYNGLLIKFGARYNTVGGDTAGERNVISGNGYSGINMTNCCPYTIPPDFYPLSVTSNSIDGNYIGLNAAGTAAVGNGRHGIWIHSGPRENTIGTNAGNVIGGNAEHGIYFSGGAFDTGVSLPIAATVVAGNTIGLDPTGVTPLGNGGYGVYLYYAANNLFHANRISANGSGGVAVESGAGEESVGNRLLENSIFANDGAGIELLGGATGGIAPPNIADVMTGTITVAGTACPGCLVELYGNPDGDGEGKWYLGNVVAAASGTFTHTVAALDGRFVTATATDEVTGTSAFSAPVAVPGEETEEVLLLPLVMKP